MSSVLSFSHVTKSFSAEGPPVLRDVSFELAAGEKVAVVGRSGSGKSTLLHLAAGIDVPSNGNVALAGETLTSLSERRRTALRRDTVGLLFQFFYLLPHLSVRDNVLLPALIAGGVSPETARRADDLLASVDLAARARDSVHVLSGGEQQRVALCRALLRRPPLLLADEPTGNLDDDNSRRVMDLLVGLSRENNSALLIVTHSPDVAARADRVWTLHSGVLSPA